MDWALAIERNRTALIKIVTDLFATVGERRVLPRPVLLLVLSILRPAEASARRLLAILARDIVVTGPPVTVPSYGSLGTAKGQRVPSFKLFDPRRRVGLSHRRSGQNGPRISAFDLRSPILAANERPALSSDVTGADMTGDAAINRLKALRGALENLPYHARRLAKRLSRQSPPPKRVMRPGRAPGYRRGGKNPIDEILSDCQALALYALHVPDTS